jgi:Flp pilus assembly protein TadB
LWLLLLGAFPRPPRLAHALNPPPRTAPPDPIEADQSGWAARIGRPAAAWLTRLGLPTTRTRRDLTTLGKPVWVHLAEQAVTAIGGLLLPPLLAVFLTAAGIGFGLTLPAAASVLLAVAGFLAPELALRSEAAKHRAGFRHALGSFLDLVVVSFAGGAGVDQALHDAATVGSGPAYAELRYALTQARLSRVPPWDTLAQLGQTVGVEELHQLAATVGLAGSEGAKVRTSLRSRAAALRTRQITDAEGEASAATERMSLPIILLFAGFLIFLGFPAVIAVLTGL